MNDVLNLESKPKRDNSAALEKARATKAANIAARKLEAANAPKPDQIDLVQEHDPSTVSFHTDSDVWIRSLLVAMETTQAKHVSHIETCVPIADKVLEVYKKKFPN